MKCKLSPSILAADFNQLGDCIQKVETTGADYLHIDVMDGTFVPSISFGMPVISSIRKNTSMFFDVHLMVEEPIRYVEDFAKAGANMITVHYEACKHLNRTIMAIKELGLKAGVALNPATPVNVLEYIMNELDMVLIMTVNPGFGGQKFIPGSIQKLKDLRKMMERLKCEADVQVDGGITLENITEVKEAGANIFVAGTSVFNGDIEENVRKFKKLL